MLDTLAPEILGDIAVFLGPLELCRLSCVCRKLRAMLDGSTMTRDFSSSRKFNLQRPSRRRTQSDNEVLIGGRSNTNSNRFSNRKSSILHLSPIAARWRALLAQDFYGVELFVCSCGSVGDFSPSRSTRLDLRASFQHSIDSPINDDSSCCCCFDWKRSNNAGRQRTVDSEGNDDDYDWPESHICSDASHGANEVLELIFVKADNHFTDSPMQSGETRLFVRALAPMGRSMRRSVGLTVALSPVRKVSRGSRRKCFISSTPSAADTEFTPEFVAAGAAVAPAAAMPVATPGGIATVARDNAISAEQQVGDEVPSQRRPGRPSNLKAARFTPRSAHLALGVLQDLRGGADVDWKLAYREAYEDPFMEVLPSFSSYSLRRRRRLAQLCTHGKHPEDVLVVVERIPNYLERLLTNLARKLIRSANDRTFMLFQPMSVLFVVSGSVNWRKLIWAARSELGLRDRERGTASFEEDGRRSSRSRMFHGMDATAVCSGEIRPRRRAQSCAAKHPQFRILALHHPSIFNFFVGTQNRRRLRGEEVLKLLWKRNESDDGFVHLEAEASMRELIFPALIGAATAFGMVALAYVQSKNTV